MPHTYQPRISASTLNDPLRAVEFLNGDAAPVFRSAGIGPTDLAGEIGLKQFVDFCEHASSILKLPDFGWRVGSVFNLQNLGEVGEFINQAPTLGAALSLFRNAFPIVQSDSELRLAVDAGQAVLTYRILDNRIWPRRQDAELTLAVFHNLIRSAAGPDWRPELLSLEHESSALQSGSKAGPRCPVQFASPANRLVFSAGLLDLPLPGGANPAFKEAAQSIVQNARQSERAAPVTVRVRRELMMRIGRESFEQTAIAAALGMSRRTLRRRLEDEGQKYSHLLAGCRMEIAKRMLLIPGAHLQDVSAWLGYSEVSAFERAFRQQEGVTPSRFRRQVSDCGLGDNAGEVALASN
ncbi:AraC-like transcriptional regulator QhpR [Leisingera sp. ANG-DT]|uniref:AraC-like transcriptional regulator QhpR n=1 Tax=Leisingera sp. ANG-DT TaxID=1577897 RepID=UPI00057F97DB|nr:AraC family transcriptional regulator [Leisingera sp. ANG-DT]KIC15673.1 AraC family transcriptional regulator [Leisingera sp. ANG-DT]